MIEKKLCACGKCGKGAVKDGLSTKCYKVKHGKPPYPPKTGEVTVIGAKIATRKPRPAKAGRKPTVAAKVGQDTPGGAETCLLVDFSEYHGAYDRLVARLVALARQEHRTPELQILHILDVKFSVEDVMVPVKAVKRLKTA